MLNQITFTLPSGYTLPHLFSMLDETQTALALSLGAYAYQTIKQHGEESYPTLIRKNYKNLYKGFSYILMRSIPSAGLGMAAYEYTKQMLKVTQ